MGKNDLNAGTMDVLILKAISAGSVHGYGIGVWLRLNSQSLVHGGEGTVYTALQRLKRKELVRSEWGVTGTGRRARIYSLTPEGRRHLAVEADRLTRYSETILLMLRDAQA